MKISHRVETPYLEFADSRVEEEWRSGRNPELVASITIHPALRVLLNAAGHWHYRATGRPALVTHMLRLPEEQRAIYPDRPGFRSPHEFGRAADCRTLDLEPERAAAWEIWINAAFAYLGRAGCRSAMIHEVGSHGRHIHLQVGPAEAWPGRHVQETQTIS